MTMLTLAFRHSILVPIFRIGYGRVGIRQGSGDRSQRTQKQIVTIAGIKLEV